MRIEYSERALADLAAIHDLLSREWPGVGRKFEARLGEIEQRILTFPNGAVVVHGRPGVLVVPFISLPYRLFYTIATDAAVILHLRHTSRASQDD